MRRIGPSTSSRGSASAAGQPGERRTAERRVHRRPVARVGRPAALRHARRQIDERLVDLGADVLLLLRRAGDDPVGGVDQRDDAVGRRLLLAEDRAEAVGAHARAEREPDPPVAHDRHADHHEVPRHAGHGEQRRDDRLVRRDDRLRPAGRERRGFVDVGLRRDRDDPAAQVREQQRRPVRLADDQPAREAVERGDVGHVEGVQRAEHVERRGRRLDLGVDRDRDRPRGRDVLAIDVGELAAPGALNAEHRQRRRAARRSTASARRRSSAGRCASGNTAIMVANDRG